MNESSSVVDPRLPPSKSKMADGGHIEFRKMFISPIWNKKFAHNLTQRCNATTPRCRCDQNRNRKLIRMTSSMEVREQMSVVLGDYAIIRIKFCTLLKIQASIIAKRAKLTTRKSNMETDRHIEFRKKMSIFPDRMKIFSPNLVERCITAIRR